MSDKPFDASGAPIEAQGRGFDGERRYSGAEELSPKAEASERSSSRRVSRETPETPAEVSAKPSPGPEKKQPSTPANKRTSVYRYLLVLFGAAFVLLLLAYFIQQRSSETAISDLRDTMNLSRAELMEEIDALKEEKAALEEQAGQLQGERDDLEKQLDDLREQHAELADDFSDQHKKVEGWLNFWVLEESFLSRDYEACAHFLQTLASSGSLNLPDSDSALARMREICDILIERGCLDEDDPANRLFGTPEPAEPEQQG